MADDEQGRDPERHLKRLAKTFNVSNRIQKLAHSKLGKRVLQNDQQSDDEVLAKAKVARAARMSSLGPVHQSILDVIASMLHIPLDEAKEGMADDEEHIKALKSIVEANGTRAIFFSYDLAIYPSKGNLFVRPKVEMSNCN